VSYDCVYSFISRDGKSYVAKGKLSSRDQQTTVYYLKTNPEENSFSNPLWHLIGLGMGAVGLLYLAALVFECIALICGR
jgi:hypothetical protein